MLNQHQVLLERYELQQKLGRTGAGRQTWLAIDRHTNHSVIVKLLAFNPEMQWDELKLFEREAQVLQALDHPRIPKYCDYFSIDDQVLWFGLVQAYIPGRSLQDLLDQGELMTEAAARQVAIELLAVLDYLHQLPQPVLHRDIKPSNLIRGDDGLIYLVDFGAVQDRATLTGVTFTVVGTCGYAPLEQFWGRAVPASDLYALGATLIHLLTGIAPADLPQRNSRIQFAEVVKLSPFFTAWLEKLTETALEKRFGSAQEAIEAIQTQRMAPSRPERRMERPDETGIVIHRTGEKLHVHIPSYWEGERSNPKNITVSILVLLVMCIVMVPYTALMMFIRPVSELWAFLFLFFGFQAVTCLILYGLNLRTDLIFEGDRLLITYQSLKFSWKSEIRVSDIVGVVLEKLNSVVYKVSLTLQRRLSSSNRSGHPQKYFIDESYTVQRNLAEPEARWLAQEIQDWLSDRD
jgi:serine/threonine protein kinase